MIGVKDYQALGRIKEILKDHEIRFRNRIEQGAASESEQIDVSLEVDRRHWNEIRRENIVYVLAVKNSMSYRDRCVISFK